jgi:hypothetical protein
MHEFCSRGSVGETPIVDGSEAAPTKCRLASWGVVYAVFGNINFAIILGASILYGPIWFAASHANAKNLFALFTSLAIGAVALARRVIVRPTDRVALGLNIALVLLLSFTILPFFLAVGPVVVANKRHTYDRYLVSVDRALLGWLYPEGQMSLALDRSTSMNPTTPFGRFYTDVLQIFYVTYYLWGYLPIIMLGYHYIVAWRRSDGNEVNRRLAQLKLYLTGWLAAFLLVFMCNTILPALSPRLYFKNQFIHPRLEGFGLAKLLIGAATDDTSFGSFPSGHFGESLVSGIYLLRIHRPTGILVIASSAMIGLATQALRYHYFTDLIGASVIVVLTLAFGFCLTSTQYRRETKRVMATYATQTGSVLFSEFNSTELNLRSSDDVSSLDDYETRSVASSDVDLEAGQPEMSYNNFVHTYI